MLIERGWIMKRAALSPNQTALVNVHTGESWTYTDLEEQIYCWATFFKAKGYKKGDRIAVLAPNSPELFAVLFACELTGLIYVPLNWRLSHHELTGLLEDCTPSTLLFHQQFQEIVEQMAYPNSNPLDSIHSISTQNGPLEIEQTCGTDPWMIIYTGGTTGKSKGVVLSINAINSNAINTITSWGLTEEDVTLNYMPLFHTGGINALSLPILMAGGKVVIGSRFDGLEALKSTNQYGATISLFVPTMHQSMINTSYFDESSFPTMKVFLSGGAPCPETIYHKFHDKGVYFKEGYGLTEAGPNNFFIRSEDAFLKIGSVGKCMLLNSAKVLNKEGNLCRADEVGELYIKGPHVFSSYWNNDTETLRALQKGWLRTGDLAKFDVDGYYYIVGRKRDLIISGGENIYPQEIEQCLIRFEEIEDAAIVGKADDIWGEAVVAFVTMAAGCTFNQDRIISHCKKLLGNYKIPKEIHLLSELPKTHVGKIDKNALQQMLR